MALVLTRLRRAELMAVQWRDVNLEDERSSLLVRRGKGGKPRRQPLPSQLVAEPERWRRERDPSPTDPVFCGLAGRRLQANILTDVIRRTATGAGLTKHVTAHTHYVTPPRRGCARRRETRDSSRSTWGTPTSRPSAATRTSPARRCTLQCRRSPTGPPRTRHPRPPGPTRTPGKPGGRRERIPADEPARPRSARRAVRCGVERCRGFPGRPRRAIP